MDNEETMTGEIITHAANTADSARYVVAKNGAVRDVVTGRIVSSENVTTKINPSNSVAYAVARREKTQQAVRSAIAKSANTRNAIVAVALGAEKLFDAVLDPEYDLDKRRKAWLSVGRVAGLIDDTRQTLDNPGQNDGVSTGALSELRNILELLVNAAQNGEK